MKFSTRLEQIEESLAAERWLKRIALLLVVLAAGAILGFFAIASTLCITVVSSVFLAVLLDPFVLWLERLRLGRSLSAALVMVALVVMIGVVAYAGYGKAAAFNDQLPAYSERIRRALQPLINRVENVKANAESIAHPTASNDEPEVRVNTSSGWPTWLVHGVGSVYGALVIIAIVPFLTFFMLVRKDPLRLRAERIVKERIDLERFVSDFSHMIRGFVIGNLVVGSITAGVTTICFVLIGLNNPLPVGIVTAALNLIPFLGLVLAMLVAWAAAIAQFSTIEPFAIITLILIILHIVAANLLVPRLIGSRVNIGPIAVTIGILFWGWLWGAFGVLLAVPITASVRILADTHPALKQLSAILADGANAPISSESDG